MCEGQCCLGDQIEQPEVAKMGEGSTLPPLPTGIRPPAEQMEEAPRSLEERIEQLALSISKMYKEMTIEMSAVEKRIVDKIEALGERLEEVVEEAVEEAVVEAKAAKEAAKKENTGVIGDEWILLVSAMLLCVYFIKG